MRKYIRHPTGIPIEYETLDCHLSPSQQAQNLSEGGLCFRTANRLEPGMPLRIRISIGDRISVIEAQVRWCRVSGDAYETGVRFADTDTEYLVRMVEQVCYIEKYRREVLEQEGRVMDSREAAEEWIQNYANRFPG